MGPVPFDLGDFREVPNDDPSPASTTVGTIDHGNHGCGAVCSRCSEPCVGSESRD
jgi:hypothetical protein